MTDTLAVVPELVRSAAESRIPMRSAQYDRIRVDTSRGTNQPAPMDLEVDDRLNELWSTLVAWAITLAEVLRVDVPSPVTPTVRERTRRGLEGLPPGVSVASAFSEFRVLVEWFDRLSSAIAASDLAGDWVEGLIAAVRPMRRWSVKPPSRSVACPLCRKGRLHVRYTKPMPPLAQQPYVAECTKCGLVPSAEEADTALAEATASAER